MLETTEHLNVTAIELLSYKDIINLKYLKIKQFSKHWTKIRECFSDNKIVLYKYFINFNPEPFNFWLYLEYSFSIGIVEKSLFMNAYL